MYIIMVNQIKKYFDGGVFISTHTRGNEDKSRLKKRHEKKWFTVFEMNDEVNANGEIKLFNRPNLD